MQHIADILSSSGNQKTLSKHFEHTLIDWDAVVVIASKHLMLPALYCQLKAKDLLQFIPEDLHSYLEEIAVINRGRNGVLLTEVHEISEILKKENIEHVFIKGVALLAAHTFNDPAERMIGDIDILVATHQLHKAFEILTHCGYNETVSFNYEPINFRHLSRQISKHKFGAIELHSEVLVHRYTHLIASDQVLKNKQIINGIAIPSTEDCIKIAILALQINNKAHHLGSISFKTIYDCIALKFATNHAFIRSLSKEKHSQSFLQLSSILFKELAAYEPSAYSKGLSRYFVFSLHHPKLGHRIHSLLLIKQGIQERFNLLVHNKTYRTHILKNKIWINKK